MCLNWMFWKRHEICIPVKYIWLFSFLFFLNNCYFCLSLKVFFFLLLFFSLLYFLLDNWRVCFQRVKTAHYSEVYYFLLLNFRSSLFFSCLFYWMTDFLTSTFWQSMFFSLLLLFFFFWNARGYIFNSCFICPKTKFFFVWIFWTFIFFVDLRTFFLRLVISVI